MGFAEEPPRFTLVTALIAVVLLGLTFGFSGARSSPSGADRGGALRGGASIMLTKTVGLGAACATTDSITVASGSTVTYCYEVENTGDQTFTTHTLVDDQLGTLLSNAPQVLAPGNTFAVTETAVITETTVNLATWTAVGSPDNAVDNDTATVTIAAPSIELFKTVGIDPKACSKETTIVLDLPADVTYCYEAHNTGNVTFSMHDLVDDQLGIILDGHAEDLAPGQFLQVLSTTEIGATTVNSATWSASNPFFVESNAMATVTTGSIFIDGFESGDTTSWSATVGGP